MRYGIALIALLIGLWARPAAAESCLPSETACILTQAVDGIDPSQIKTIPDENLAFGAATSVVLLGDDKQRQEMLDKIQKIPNGLVPQKAYIPGTTPDGEKSYAAMMLQASLGNVPEVVKTIQGLKAKNESFEKGLEPQVRIVDRLTVMGQLDAAKDMLKATREIRFRSDGFTTEWTWPHGPPALLLIKAFLNEGRPQEAQDVAAMLKEPNVFSRSVSDDAVQALFTRYGKAPKDAAQKPVPPEPPETPPAGAKFAERDKILALLKNGRPRIARAEFNMRPKNREIVLHNIMKTFAGATAKPEHYDDIFNFYLEGCQELYPEMKTARSRCLLMLLVDTAAKKETAVNRAFDAKYPAACTMSTPGGSCR